jgi:N-acetylmuramic acid 6-phosphate etherase
VGPEVITGSTRMKAGTATKLVLNMITTTMMIKLNKTYGNLMVDLNATNEKLLDRGTRIIAYLTNLDYKDSSHLLKSANGEVKTAIVMNKHNCTYDDGAQLLQSVDGNLKKALIK